ncbi:carbohydrate ABC transporter substrate-binding protein, CUT1 family [Paenibacillus sp. cl141a]|uniref:ABC transporter substrate-binding protein n=1 Tax=Paenibacillus sp. cl141a TaxID=1761877 RepID=UPI0008CFC9D4|nr:extracellular solute-binding protein [Paenibacillus sp. cl141a]SEL71965.1 carbohydrate ABC transporter substrate-binding protein, CUT1 family [Paenibacillus sp. cl141a]
MKSKWSSMLLCILSAMVILSGCASGTKNAGGEERAGQTGSQTTISVWTLNNGWEWFASAVEDFENANPDINVELTQYEVDPYKESLKIAASSKTLPDMWFTWGGTLGSFYPENGLTLDLTQVSADHKWSDIYNKTAIDMSTYDGKVSGIPIHLNVLGMWYSNQIYEELNLKAPSTFAEFEEQLAILKENDITPLSFGSKGGWHTMRLTEQLLEYFAGPELHDKLKSLEASWNDPAVVKTFEKIKEYTDNNYFPVGYSSLDPMEAESLFYQGNTGMINEGTWFDRNITSNGVDPNDYGVFKFPTEHTPARSSVFVEMLQINGEIDSDKQEAAIKLGEYLTGKEVVNKYIGEYGSPALTEFEVSENTPHQKILLDHASEGGFLITDQALPQEVVQKIFEAQDKVALKEWTPEQAAENIDKAVNVYKSKQK